jgi:hypothetical protein
MKTYTFHVSLPGTGRAWRKIEMRADQTLEYLHFAIQDAYEWDADHLYSFFMSGRAWDEDSEYTLPEGEWDEIPEEPSAGPGDVRTTTIESLGLKPRQEFMYLFDYGDEWRFKVRVHAINENADPKAEYPRLVESVGEAPEQYPE